MAVEVIDKIKPKNGGSFPIVEAVDVEVSEGVRLPEALAAKADTSTTDNLQSQIDQIAQAAGTGTADTEVAQARVGADGTTYQTLKERLDAENTKHDAAETSLTDDINFIWNTKYTNDITETATADGKSIRELFDFAQNKRYRVKVYFRNSALTRFRLNTSSGTTTVDTISDDNTNISTGNTICYTFTASSDADNLWIRIYGTTEAEFDVDISEVSISSDYLSISKITFNDNGNKAVYNGQSDIEIPLCNTEFHNFENSITEIVESDKNLFRSDWIKNRRYTNSGAISTGDNTNYIASDYFDISENIGEKLYISGLPTGIECNFFIYDTNKVFISRSSVSSVIDLREASNTAKYAIIATKSAFASSQAMDTYTDNATVMLSEEQDAPYEPWKKTAIKSSSLQLENTVCESNNPITAKAVSDALASFTPESSLPDYYQTAIAETVESVINTLELDSIVFGVFTDIHFTDYNDPNYDAKMRQVSALNVIANSCPLDFTLDNGDLLTYCTKEFSLDILNKSQGMYSNCRVPHLMNVGDHDFAQSDVPLTETDYARLSYPYMPSSIVRSSQVPLSYYYDITYKKTRIVVLNDGGDLAGSHAVGGDDIFDWLMDDVFTDDKKNGWQFIILTHGPIDYEWGVGMQRRASTSSSPKWKFVALCDLFEAINNAETFNAERTQGTQTVYFDQYGVIVTSDSPDVATSGEYTFKGNLSEKIKDYSSWTSKVRMVFSGHCHCDRLNAKTNGKNVSYGIAYTGSASPSGYKDEDDYYIPVFGTNGHTAEWENLKNRTEGNISEALMDIYIINSSSIHRIRFGCGDENTPSVVNV